MKKNIYAIMTLGLGMNLSVWGVGERTSPEGEESPKAAYNITLYEKQYGHFLCLKDELRRLERSLNEKREEIASLKEQQQKWLLEIKNYPAEHKNLIQDFEMHLNAIERFKSARTELKTFSKKIIPGAHPLPDSVSEFLLDYRINKKLTSKDPEWKWWSLTWEAIESLEEIKEKEEGIQQRLCLIIERSRFDLDYHIRKHKDSIKKMYLKGTETIMVLEQIQKEINMELRTAFEEANELQQSYALATKSCKMLASSLEKMFE